MSSVGNQHSSRDAASSSQHTTRQSRLETVLKPELLDLRAQLAMLEDSPDLSSEQSGSSHSHEELATSDIIRSIDSSPGDYPAMLGIDRNSPAARQFTRRPSTSRYRTQSPLAASRVPALAHIPSRTPGPPVHPNPNLDADRQDEILRNKQAEINNLRTQLRQSQERAQRELEAVREQHERKYEDLKASSAVELNQLREDTKLQLKEKAEAAKLAQQALRIDKEKELAQEHAKLERAEAKSEDLKAQLKQCQQELGTVRRQTHSQIEQLQSELSNLTTALAEQEKQLEFDRAAKTRAFEEKNAALTELTKVRTTLQEVQGSLEQAEQRAEIAEQDKGTAETEATKYEAEKKLLLKELNALKREMADLEEGSENNIKSLEAIVENTEARLFDATEKLKQLENEAIQTGRIIESYKSRQHELEKELLQNRKLIPDLQTQNSALEDKVKSLLYQASTNDTVKGLNKTISQLQNEIAAKSALITERDGTIKALQQELEPAMRAAALVEAQTARDEYMSANQRLQKSLDNFKGRVATLESSKYRLEEEKEFLESQCKSLESSHNKLQDDFREQLQAQLRGIKDELRHQQQQAEHFQQLHHQKEVEFVKVRDEYLAAVQKLQLQLSEQETNLKAQLGAQKNEYEEKLRYLSINVNADLQQATATALAEQQHKLEGKFREFSEQQVRLYEQRVEQVHKTAEQQVEQYKTQLKQQASDELDRRIAELGSNSAASNEASKFKRKFDRALSVIEVVAGYHEAVDQKVASVLEDLILIKDIYLRTCGLRQHYENQSKTPRRTLRGAFTFALAVTRLRTQTWRPQVPKAYSEEYNKLISRH